MLPLAGVSFVLGLAALLIGVAMPASAQSQSGVMPRTITVSATGTVAAVPDTALVQVGAVTTGANVQDALDANSAVVDRLIAGLKDLGIAERDISTTRFDVSPEYNRNQKSGNEPPSISGYRVTNMLQVRVGNLQLFGTVLDRAVQLGANQVGGVELIVSEAEKLKDEARQKAVAEARSRGQLYAEAAGVRIVSIISIDEQGGSVEPRPMQYARTAASVPIEAGERTLSVDVRMVFAID